MDSCLRIDDWMTTGRENDQAGPFYTRFSCLTLTFFFKEFLQT